MDYAIAVCRPDSLNIRMVLNCPNCKRRRRFGGFDAPWYGITITCCACGDTWTSGEMHTRPFARGWRQKSAAKAREYWTTGVRLGSPTHQKFIDDTMGA